MSGHLLVTGASAGVGAALCRYAIQRGWRVSAWARRGDRLDALRRECGDHLAVATVDVTDAAAVARGVDAAVAAHGPFHAVVANAGRGLDGAILDLTADDLAAVFDVNLLGVHRCLTASRPHWAAGARVIVVSSIVADISVPRMGGYCASKHALDAYAAALRMELAGTGHHVCSINPGTIATEFFDVAPAPGRAWTWRPGRPLTPERVAAAIERAARGTRRRRIVLPWTARPLLLLARLAPGLIERVLRWILARS